jgi:hypothetical protein
VGVWKLCGYLSRDAKAKGVIHGNLERATPTADATH